MISNPSCYSTTDPISITLSIIGAITGIIALFISYWTYRQANPRLEVTITKCKHNYENQSDGKQIIFWTQFQVKNFGDRGTRINDIGPLFKIGERAYNFKKQYFRGNRSDQTRWVEAHDTITLEADFVETYNDQELKKIPCTFTIFQTHGANIINCVSDFSENP